MTPTGLTGTGRCACHRVHQPALVAVTGGPGAGKTAVLEVARRQFCAHVVVLPESATIVYGGGFPRLDSATGKRRAQIAIAHVQDQMERIEIEEGRAALVLGDRSVLDGLAYWPGDDASYFHEVHLSREEALARYRAVVHLRPPADGDGYENHGNPLRIESAREAAEIDARIERAYAGHPDRHFVESTPRFVDKVAAVTAILDRYLPECCR